MSNRVWAFGEPHDSETQYMDGTVVPGRHWVVYYDSEPVGEIEVHLHKRRGPDRKDDISFGATFIAYGPPNKVRDAW